MRFLHITDKRFARYGTIVTGYDFTEAIAFLERDEYPAGIEYVASSPQLEKLPVCKEFSERFYGQMPVQMGYCMGHNVKMNGLEFHLGSEVIIAVTDLILMAGLQQDIEPGFRYDTNKVECFLIPAGYVAELYATTLHYCMCHCHPEGFAHACFLPRGTNMPLTNFTPVDERDRFLQAKNKWLMAHPDGGQAESVPRTLYGPNWDVADLKDITA